MRLIFLGFMFFVSAGVFQQDEDRTSKLLKDIKKHINQAGQQYKAEKYNASANQIGAAQNKMTRCFKENAAEYKDVLLKEYKRIAKAHELLTAKGIEMKQLTPFPDDFGTASAKPEDEMNSSSGDDDSASADSDDASPDGNTVSFKSDIAPILSQHCGNCHIRRSQGDYSMSSFEKLIQDSSGDDSIVAGKPDESLLYDLIDSGDMPPRDEVPKKDLTLIKKWIEQGAKFDGEDRKASFGNSRGDRRGRGGR